MYLYLEPLVTLIGAYFLLNEAIQWITLVGGGMILLGVYLAARKFSFPSPRSLSAAGRSSRQRREGGRDKRKR
jgi:drug/metabolite transporter (DMT)-like permease